MEDGFVEVGGDLKPPPGFVPFKIIGDSFKGKYLRRQEAVNNFDPTKKDNLAIFATKDAATGQVVERAINPNPDLERRLALVQFGDFVRITFASTVETGQKSPMKVFKLERHNGAATPVAPKPSSDEIPF